MQATATLKTARQHHDLQVHIVSELKIIMALVEVSSQTVEHVNADETESAVIVLSMACDKLFGLLQTETKRLALLEALAYPEYEEGAQS